MFGHWYNSSLRRYIVLMGDLFSHVQIQRMREDTGMKYIKVPITYASKEHFMMQLGKINAIQNIPSPDMSPEERAAQIAKIETILPRMNLHLVDMMYNPQYKTALQNRSLAQYRDNDPRKAISQFSPVPMKMIFELGIYTRNQDDMFQIIEQIMPYFQPHFNTTITELYTNEIKFERDIRIVFQSLAMDEVVEGESTSKRRLEWSVMFEVNGWLYPPVANLEGEIKTVYLDFFANTRELTPEGNFESVDSEIVPRDVEQSDWDGTSIQTYDSSGKPIPVAPEPPGPRGT